MSNDVSPGQSLEGFRRDFESLRREIGRVFVGQPEVVDGLLTAVVCGGHVLLEGLPGVGKTRLIETLAEALDVTFQRIQFTPDLMPSNLIGTYVVMESAQGRRTFEFQKGPLFSHVILADQLNRGTPKTQSALLEAMEGQTVTVSNETFELPSPFFVMATQNPREMEGTFPLPEPEIDRFFCKLVLPPPTVAQLEEIVERTTQGEPPPVLAVVDRSQMLEMRAIARAVSMPAEVRRFAVVLVAASHAESPQAPPSIRRYVQYGSSPRGAQALALAAKVHAIMAGRGEASVGDVRAVAPMALRHRLMLNFEGQADGVAPDRLVTELVESVLADGPQSNEATGR